jgi:hypothetical protein
MIRRSKYLVTVNKVDALSLQAADRHGTARTLQRGARRRGGEGGIRTHDPLTGTPVFKSQGTLIRATHSRANAFFSRMRDATL